MTWYFGQLLKRIDVYFDATEWRSSNAQMVRINKNVIWYSC
jgi:hypothetical protein